MNQFAGPVTAKWVDPTSGASSTINGSPFTNSGTHSFSPSGNNNAGDPDWALQLTA
jgi:Putative collagen-binding domain of a collagenase